MVFHIARFLLVRSEFFVFVGLLEQLYKRSVLFLRGLRIEVLGDVVVEGLKAVDLQQLFRMQ